MTDHEGQWLLALARQSVEQALDGLPAATPESPPAVAQQPGACFVTLTRQGALRGCIGSLEAHRPLWLDVSDNARAAALRDPRFAPLSRAELADTHFSLSLLATPEPIHAGSRDALLAQLEPGRHGLTISGDGRRATFLPSVWQQLPDPQQFLDRLKEKAGLGPDYPESALSCERYTVTSVAD